MVKIFEKTAGFLSGSYEELKKVSTPSWEETKRSTFVAIVVVILLAVLILIIDWVFGNVSNLIIPSVID